MMVSLRESSEYRRARITQEGSGSWAHILFVFLPPVSFHEHHDLSEVHKPEADKTDDLHFRPGDITVEKTAEHMMPLLRTRQQLSANKNRYLMTALQRLLVNLISD